MPVLKISIRSLSSLIIQKLVAMRQQFYLFELIVRNQLFDIHPYSSSACIQVKLMHREHVMTPCSPPPVNQLIADHQLETKKFLLPQSSKLLDGIIPLISNMIFEVRQGCRGYDHFGSSNDLMRGEFLFPEAFHMGYDFFFI